MKTPFVALLMLLLSGGYARAVGPTDASCQPPEFPWHLLVQLRMDIDGQNWQGFLCVRACKAELAPCKKVASNLRKCRDNAAKGYYKAQSLTCQLGGGEKQSCVDSSKAAVKAERQKFKGELAFFKLTCGQAYELCRDACAP